VREELGDLLLGVDGWHDGFYAGLCRQLCSSFELLKVFRIRGWQGAHELKVVLRDIMRLRAPSCYIRDS
jgi:hypothetical protein